MLALTTTHPILQLGGPNFAADVLRVICIVGGAPLLTMTLRALYRETRSNTRSVSRVAGTMMALGSVVVDVFTEAGRLGHTITWRLPLNLTIVVCGTIAYWWLLPWSRKPTDSFAQAGTCPRCHKPVGAATLWENDQETAVVMTDLSTRLLHRCWAP